MFAISSSWRAPWAALLVISCGVGEPGVVDTDAPENVLGVTGTLVEPGPELPLAYPTRIALGDDGVVYVTDVKQDAVFGYLDGVRVLQIPDIERPLGVAVHGRRLYVGSDGRGRVEVYELDGPRHLGHFGTGELGMPNDLAVSPDGQLIFVADSAADRVVVFAPDGTLLQRIGSSGDGPDALDFPVSVDVDEHHLLVGDQTHHRVQLFTLQGQHIRALGGQIDGESDHLDAWDGRFTRVQDVALDGDVLYVLDSFYGHVQVLDLEGVSAGYLGRRGPCDTCVALPLDIVRGLDDTLLVTDPERGRWVTLPLTLRSRP